MRSETNKGHAKSEKFKVALRAQQSYEERRPYGLPKISKENEVQDSINKVLCKTTTEAFKLFEKLCKNNEIKFVKNTECLQQLARKCINFIPNFIINTLCNINNFTEKQKKAEQLYNILSWCGFDNTQIEQNPAMVQQAKEIARHIANNNKEQALNIIKEIKTNNKKADIGDKEVQVNSIQSTQTQQTTTTSTVYEEVSDVTDYSKSDNTNRIDGSYKEISSITFLEPLQTQDISEQLYNELNNIAILNQSTSEITP